MKGGHISARTRRELEPLGLPCSTWFKRYTVFTSPMHTHSCECPTVTVGTCTANKAAATIAIRFSFQAFRVILCLTKSLPFLLITKKEAILIGERVCADYFGQCKENEL